MWFAQTVPTTDLTGIAGVVTQVGISAIFIWLYRDATVERRAAQAKADAIQASKDSLLERLGPLLSDAMETLNDVRLGMRSDAERMAQLPDRRDMDMFLRRAELMMDELNSEMKEQRGRRRGVPGG